MAKILIVEDETAIAENLHALLTARGYEVAWIPDGADALSIAKKQKPDIVLLDVMLPRVSGFDICRLLKSDPDTAKIKIIMITGLGRMGDVEKAFGQGADDYIIKPFDSERLFRKVEKALGAA